MRRAAGVASVRRVVPRVVRVTTGLVVVGFLAGCADDPGTSSGAFGTGGATASSTASGGGETTRSMGGPDRFGFGQALSAADIAVWDIDVGPEGEGLPPGSGDARAGAAVYEAACVACHGDDGTGGPNGAIVVAEVGGPFPDGFTRGVPATIGNYWPYATTIFDYVRRAMPFNTPGSLTDDEVYAVTAWMLWRNGLIGEDEVMDATTLPAVEMPARDHFVPSPDVNLTTLP